MLAQADRGGGAKIRDGVPPFDILSGQSVSREAFTTPIEVFTMADQPDGTDPVGDGRTPDPGGVGSS